MHTTLRGLVVALFTTLALVGAGLAAPVHAAEPEVGPPPPTVSRKLTKAEVKRLPAAIQEIKALKNGTETSKGGGVSMGASLTWTDYRLSWSVWTPYLVSMEAINNRGAQTMAGAQSVACVGFAFVPVFGTTLAAICAVSSIVDSVVYHYGYCPKITINAISRNVTKSYTPC